MILRKTSVERIRISSLGPEFLSDEFFAIIEDRRCLPHFHLSIQSFADGVLQAMNRNYDSAILDRVLRRFRQIHRSDRHMLSLGADMIV